MLVLCVEFWSNTYRSVVNLTKMFPFQMECHVFSEIISTATFPSNLHQMRLTTYKESKRNDVYHGWICNMFKVPNGVFTLIVTDTETKTEKMETEPNGNLRWYLSLCNVNTSTHFYTCHYYRYRSGTVNSKSFVGKVFLRIKRKFELTYAL